MHGKASLTKRRRVDVQRITQERDKPLQRHGTQEQENHYSMMVRQAANRMKVWTHGWANGPTKEVTSPSKEHNLDTSHSTQEQSKPRPLHDKDEPKSVLYRCGGGGNGGECGGGNGGGCGRGQARQLTKKVQHRATTEIETECHHTHTTYRVASCNRRTKQRVPMRRPGKQVAAVNDKQCQAQDEDRTQEVAHT
eukprot:6485700-Amphidinium_carterae.1